jgi:hypothetical protein
MRDIGKRCSVLTVVAFLLTAAPLFSQPESQNDGLFNIRGLIQYAIR